MLLAVALAGLLAGCWHAPDAPPAVPTPGGTPTQEPEEPRLTFGGVVLDAGSREPVGEATVRLDLAQTRPCRREGIIWNAYDLEVNATTGRFGPFPIARPRSDDVAFFLHVKAPGRSENVTFLGPDEARQGTRNLTILLHPDAAFEGSAPQGTVVALEAPRFPRFAVAGEEGRFSFPAVPSDEAGWVAATEPPVTGRMTPPANVSVAPPEADAWRLEGVVRSASGAPLAADVVARSQGALVSAGRSGPNGLFVLPLRASAPQDLLVEARTPDGALGGSLRVLVEGPPAVRQSLVVRPLC